MFAGQIVFDSGFHNLWRLSDRSVEGDPPVRASKTPFGLPKRKQKR